MANYKTAATVALQFIRESSHTKEANLEGRLVEMSESGHYLTARSLYDGKAFSCHQLVGYAATL